MKKLIGYGHATFSVAATEHSKKHEEQARRTYAAYMNYVSHTGLTVQPSGLTLHPTMSFLGASSDGHVHDPCMNPPDGLLEIKCPFSIDNVDVRSLPPVEIARRFGSKFCLSLNSDGGLELNRAHKFFTQVQGELAVMQRPWADFVVYTLAPADNIFVQRIKADSVFWKDVLLPELVKFYTSALVPELLLRRVQQGLALFPVEHDEEEH